MEKLYDRHLPDWTRIWFWLIIPTWYKKKDCNEVEIWIEGSPSDTVIDIENCEEYFLWLEKITLLQKELDNKFKI